MAIKSSARGTRPVILAVIHAAQGARTAASLAAYFDRDDIKASSHDIVDASTTLHILSYDRAAWTLRSGNPISDNLEICGFSEWSRAQWLSTGIVDGCVNPRAMVRRTAAWVLARARARGLPLRRLSHAQLRAGERGIIHHHDWTVAMRDGTHWDVGVGFPWDVMWADIDDMIGEDDMSAEAEQRITNYLDAKVSEVLGVVREIKSDVDSIVRWTKPLDTWHNKDEWQADVASTIRGTDLPALSTKLDAINDRLDAVLKASAGE